MQVLQTDPRWLEIYSIFSISIVDENQQELYIFHFFPVLKIKGPIKSLV